MIDDIRRWSDELAREPSSLVFLQLGEELRRRGQLDVAHKIALRGLERHQRNVDAHDLVARIAVDRHDLARALTEWDAVLRIEPTHIGAMKGLGYVHYHQGHLDDAEQYLERAVIAGGGDDVKNALEMVRRTMQEPDAPAEPLPGQPEAATAAVRAPTPAPGTAVIPMLVPSFGPTPAHGVVAISTATPAAGIATPSAASRAIDPADDPRNFFEEILLDTAQVALLLDGSGLVLAGKYPDGTGRDVSADVGAQLSGITEDVVRSARHLDLGAWKAVTFETKTAVVAMAPTLQDSLVVVAASRATPLGLVRRLLERCGTFAGDWMASGALRRAHRPAPRVVR